MSRWFRMYDTVVEDPKVQRLPDSLFKTWINLLCLACRSGGFLPGFSDLAFTLRLSETETKKRVAALIKAGLIDEDATSLKPHKWDIRQFKSDGSSDRVKRFRERSKSVSATPDETGPEAETDTDTETDTENLQAQHSTISAAAPADFDNSISEENSAIRHRCEQAAGREFLHFGAILTLIDQGADLDKRILPVIRDVMESCRRNGRDPPSSWRYFIDPVLDAGRPIKGPGPAKAKERDFRSVPDNLLSNDDYWKKRRQLKEGYAA